MPVSLEDLTELVAMPLLHECSASGDDEALFDDQLADSAQVTATRCERLTIVETPAVGLHPPLDSRGNPAVAKNERPFPPSQNTRGRTTPREKPGEVRP